MDVTRPFLFNLFDFQSNFSISVDGKKLELSFLFRYKEIWDYNFCTTGTADRLRPGHEGKAIGHFTQVKDKSLIISWLSQFLLSFQVELINKFTSLKFIYTI